MIQPYEISIGSLIKTNRGEIIKVESISTKRQHRKVGYHKDGDISHIHYVRLAQCEGIPLTEEILIANGFILRGKTSIEDNDIYYKVYVCDDNKVYEMNYRPLDGQLRLYWKNTIFGIHYVHDLQMALRLCGLNELADNIKVKEE